MIEDHTPLLGDAIAPLFILDSCPAPGTRTQSLLRFARRCCDSERPLGSSTAGPAVSGQTDGMHIHLQNARSRVVQVIYGSFARKLSIAGAQSLDQLPMLGHQLRPVAVHNDH